MRPTLFPRPPCALTQRPQPAEGTAVTASPRDGRGTANKGPRGHQARKRRPPQPALLGYSTRTPSGMGNRTSPRRARHPGVYTVRRSQRPAASLPPSCAACGTQAQDPPRCWGRSDTCTAAAVPCVPRGCPGPFPGPPSRIGHSGPLATVRAAGSIALHRTRVSGVSSVAFAGAGQGVTPSRPLARHYATP